MGRATSVHSLSCGIAPWSIGAWWEREKTSESRDLHLWSLLLVNHRVRINDLWKEYRRWNEMHLHLSFHLENRFRIIVVWKKKKPKKKSSFNVQSEHPTEQNYCVHYEYDHYWIMLNLASMEWEKRIRENASRLSRTCGSNAWANSLKSPKFEPSLRSSCVQFNKTETIACVAQALVITCRAKKISSRRESFTRFSVGVSVCCHLNRKINPWHGLAKFNRMKNFFVESVRTSFARDYHHRVRKFLRLELRLRLKEQHGCFLDRIFRFTKSMNEISKYTWIRFD